MFFVSIFVCLFVLFGIFFFLGYLSTAVWKQEAFTGRFVTTSNDSWDFSRSWQLSYITRLHHFRKYIILNNILKVDNILNRGLNNTRCAPSVPLFRIHWQLERLNTGKRSITWWRRSRWSKTKLCFTHAWIRRFCILYFLYSTCNMLVYRRTRDQVWLRDRSGSHALHIDISFGFVQVPRPALRGQLFRSQLPRRTPSIMKWDSTNNLKTILRPQT